MSMAWFCGSLPAGAFGYPDGRGTTDIFRRTAKPPAQADIVRWTAKPPAPASRLTRWNQLCSSNELISLSPTDLDKQIEVDLSTFLTTYKSGRVQRYKGTSVIPGSLEVASKDVVIDPVTGVSVRLYLPSNVDLTSKKLPILVYFHGGGFVIENTGSPNYHNYLTLLASNAGVLIVSVNYRLAPEHPLPASYDDCQAALNWVVSHSAGPALEPWLAEHGDFSQLFLAGDSAGGNITHYIAMRADPSVNIEGIAIVHPYFLGSEPTVGKETENPTDFVFHENLWRFAAPNTEGLDDPLINPLAPGAPSLKGLKCRRAVVFVAGNDFHYERGRMYYNALVNSGWGGKAELVEHEGVGHVFHLSDYSNNICVAMMTKMVAFLKGD